MIGLEAEKLGIIAADRLSAVDALHPAEYIQTLHRQEMQQVDKDPVLSKSVSFPAVDIDNSHLSPLV